MPALANRTGDESADNLQRKLGIAIFIGEAVGFLTGIRQLCVAEASQNGRGFKSIEKSAHALLIGLDSGDNCVAPCILGIQG